MGAGLGGGLGLGLDDYTMINFRFADAYVENLYLYLLRINLNKTESEVYKGERILSMTNSTANNFNNSDWCLGTNLTKEEHLDSDSLDVDVVIESIIVPIVGSFGIGGRWTSWFAYYSIL